MADRDDDYLSLIEEDNKEVEYKAKYPDATLNAQKRREEAETKPNADLITKEGELRRKEAKKLSDYEKALRAAWQAEETKKRLNSLEDELSRAKSYEEEYKIKRKIAQDELLLAQQEALEKELTAREESATSTSEKMTKAAAQLTANVLSSAMSSIEGLYSEITTAAEDYASYVDRISVHLVGANETFESVVDVMGGVFGDSLFFKMSDVMETTAQAIESGISFNVESRAAMQVLSDKVAATFDAFTDTMDRLIRIQQEDTTQARLGMESLMTEFLNEQWQTTEYLVDNISESVSSALLEAESLLTGTASTELEYTIQKWLGSFYSAGVSQSTVTTIAEGLGYLASGDVSSLSSNDDLQTLLVAAANAGGADYGNMLLNGVTSSDINALMEGILTLASAVDSLDSNVAKTSYASVYGLSVSDIQGLMNVDDDAVEAIVSNTASYDDLLTRVETESTFSKLLSRTSGASLATNLYQNFLFATGESLGSNVNSYLTWKMAGIINDALSGIDLGVEVDPFGVGVSTKINISDITKIATVLGGAGAGLAEMIGNFDSLTKGVDLSKLVSESMTTTTKGNLTDFASDSSGTSKVGVSSNVSYEYSDVQKTASATMESTTEEYQDEDYDEAEDKVNSIMETVLTMGDVGEDLKFIIQLMNEDGVVVRGKTGTVETVEYSGSSTTTTSSDPFAEMRKSYTIESVV